MDKDSFDATGRQFLSNRVNERSNVRHVLWSGIAAKMSPSPLLEEEARAQVGQRSGTFVVSNSRAGLE